MRTLIIGSNGEVGGALRNVLKDYYPFCIDKDEAIPPTTDIEILHICFGFSDTFIEDVKKYQKEYKPEYTIIHSTVPVGTCRQLKAIHSPVIGQHPFLEEGLRTFPKML